MYFLINKYLPTVGRSNSMQTLQVHRSHDVEGTGQHFV